MLIPGALSFVAAFGCVVLGSAIQGSTGLGFGMVAAPLLAIIDPALVPGPLLVLALMVSIMLAAREWRSIDRRGLAISLSGRVPASILAGVTLSVLPESVFGTLFSALLLLAIGLSLTGWHLRPTPLSLLAAGAASGYMGTITSVGAPPMAMVYQRSAGPQVRSTMGAFFVIGSLISILVLVALGHFGGRDLLRSAALAPGVLIGFVISGWGRRWVDRGSMRVALLTLSAVSALLLLVDSVS